jgi:hypothetical protein
MTELFSPPNDFIARQAEIRLIELKRGSTLKLEHAAGATLRLVNGEAWVCACRRAERMRAGEPAMLNGPGTILIYALADSSLCLEGVGPCDVELRRRGEVASSAPPVGDEGR